MLRTILRALGRRRNWERDLEQELGAHIDERAADLVRRGLTEEDAERQARIELGQRETYKEQCREAHGLRWPDEIRQDLHYGIRVLLRSRGFTAVAVLSLALGIGANMVVFSVLNALLLRPLPVAAPERLFAMNNGRGVSQSFPNYRAIRDRNTVFESLFAKRIVQVALGTGDGARRVWGYLVTGNYFATLGLRPALGRFFTPADDVQTDGSPWAVLSYSCWQSRFAGDPSIAGKRVMINGYPYTVLGVAPRGFHGTEVFYWSEVWLPMTMQPRVEGRSWLDNPQTFNAWVEGRLKAGVTEKQADANLAVVAAELARERTVNQGMRLWVSRPGLAGAMGRAPTRAFLSGVMLLAGLVLLAACANLAVLLAARASDRAREFAVRVSIGAGKGRIIRQLLTESVLISILGGAAGCGLAVVLLRLLSKWRAPLDFPIQFDVAPDAGVFAFAFAAALLTGVLFGIAPARQAWKSDPNAALKGSVSQGAGRRWAMRDMLLATQVALCCLLVTASLVSLRGLMRSFETPLGFTPRGVAVACYDLELANYKREAGRAFQQRALDAAARLPGVASAAYSSSVPLSIDQSNTTVYPELTTDFRPANAIRSAWYVVSPDYFRTVGTRLLSGRDFTTLDREGTPGVAIVNETFARTVLGTRDALGRRYVTGPGEKPVEVVGIVEDGKYETLTETPSAATFRPILQLYSSSTVLSVRTVRPETEVAAELRQAIATLDPVLPVYGAGSLQQMLGFVYLPARAAVIALSAFGLLAVMLAVTGIYGLTAYAVSRRVREIGIRMAIGARPREVLALVLGRTAWLVGAGSAVGLTAGVLGSQVLASVVYGASPRDPALLGLVAVTMLVVGIASAAGPARLALRVDPVRSLRVD